MPKITKTKPNGNPKKRPFSCCVDVGLMPVGAVVGKIVGGGVPKVGDPVVTASVGEFVGKIVGVPLGDSLGICVGASLGA